MNLSEIVGSLHPALVHLPIGMLTLYAVLEILPLKRLESHVSYRYTKGIIVCAGMIGAFFSLSTGDAAAETHVVNRAILEFHETVAGATTWFFGILAGIYIIAWLRDVEQLVHLEKLPLLKKVWDILSRVANALDKPLLRRVLALLGFIALSLTGILGGALVYGSNADPLVHFVIQLLGLN